MWLFGSNYGYDSGYADGYDYVYDYGYDYVYAFGYDDDTVMVMTMVTTMIFPCL